METLARTGFLWCQPRSRMSAREMEQRWREGKGKGWWGGGRMLGFAGSGSFTVTSGARRVVLHPGKVGWNVACYTFSFRQSRFCSERKSSTCWGCAASQVHAYLVQIMSVTNVITQCARTAPRKHGPCFLGAVLAHGPCFLGAVRAHRVTTDRHAHSHARTHTHTRTHTMHQQSQTMGLYHAQRLCRSHYPC